MYVLLEYFNRSLYISVFSDQFTYLNILPLPETHWGSDNRGFTVHGKSEHLDNRTSLVSTEVSTLLVLHRLHCIVQITL